jgi:hypothetical protein
VFRRFSLLYSFENNTKKYFSLKEKFFYDTDLQKKLNQIVL